MPFLTQNCLLIRPKMVQLIGPFLFELIDNFGLKVAFSLLFYIDYIGKVEFWDIPGRTKIALKYSKINIFQFRRKLLNPNYILYLISPIYFLDQILTHTPLPP